jgi:hypothetical protein
MEFNRKLTLCVGAFVLFFLAWLAYINFKSPIPAQIEETIVPVTEMVQLRHDLSKFISEKFKKEQPDGELVEVSLQNPLEDGTDKVKVPYHLTYKNSKAGTTATIQAMALLSRASDELWKVTKVVPQKEVITYEGNSVIKAGSH